LACKKLFIYNLKLKQSFSFCICVKKKSKQHIFHKKYIDMLFTFDVTALTVLMTISFLPFCSGQQDKTKLASYNNDKKNLASHNKDQKKIISSNNKKHTYKEIPIKLYLVLRLL
jgi:hypothetical protein